MELEFEEKYTELLIIYLLLLILTETNSNSKVPVSMFSFEETNLLIIAIRNSSPLVNELEATDLSHLQME